MLPAPVLGQDATLYFDLCDEGYGASTMLRNLDGETRVSLSGFRDEGDQDLPR